MAKMVYEQGAQVAMKKRRHVYEACLPTLLCLILYGAEGSLLYIKP